jgi:hypothetical protein
LTCIDPAPTPQFLAWASLNTQVQHVALPSLDAFGEVQDIDAWVIDGDHNWYTVYHELIEVEKVCRRDGKPLLAFFHDVIWPCARRDMYYAPERIPAEYLQPHRRDAGVVFGNPGLVENRGFRGNDFMAWAEKEGGPRNGVLTAIEDFLAERLKEGRQFGFAEIPAVMGLGVLFDLDAPWSARLANYLMPYHRNGLIQIMENDRMNAAMMIDQLQSEAKEKEAAARKPIPTISDSPSIAESGGNTGLRFGTP